MKKVLRSLLVCLMSVSAAQAGVVANKTFYTSRNEMHHLGRAWALKKHGARTAPAGKHGIDVAVNPFFSRSTNQTGMGEYFGASNTVAGTDAGSVQVLEKDKTTNALFSLDIDHDQTQAATGHASGKMTFKPEQTRSGANIAVSMPLDRFKAFQGVTVSVDANVIRVENDLGMGVADEVANTTTKKTVKDFFAGNYEQAAGVNAQSALKNGKVSSTPLVETNISDVRGRVTYAFVDQADCGVDVTASVVIPAGNESTDEFMWQPVTGNNGHFELAAGINGFMDAWSGKDWKVRFSGGVEYGYGLKATEKRMLGVYDTSKSMVKPWGHARLAAELGKQGTFPLANKLVSSVDVTPGSRFEGVFGVAVDYKSFFFNVGYDMFYRAKETVRTQPDSWKNETFGYAKWDYSANANAAWANVDGGPIQMFAKTTTGTGETVTYFVSPETCETPAQATHSFLASAGYSRKIKNFPVRAVIGGSYEVAEDSNTSLQGWAVFGQIGFGF